VSSSPNLLVPGLAAAFVAGLYSVWPPGAGNSPLSSPCLWVCCARGVGRSGRMMPTRAPQTSPHAGHAEGFSIACCPRDRIRWPPEPLLDTAIRAGCGRPPPTLRQRSSCHARQRSQLCPGRAGRRAGGRRGGRPSRAGWSLRHRRAARRRGAGVARTRALGGSQLGNVLPDAAHHREPGSRGPAQSGAGI